MNNYRSLRAYLTSTPATQKVVRDLMEFVDDPDDSYAVRITLDDALYNVPAPTEAIK